MKVVQKTVLAMEEKQNPIGGYRVAWFARKGLVAAENP
jgi:hypothetical protein